VAEQEGGRWDVGVKGNIVYLARVSDDGERLFEDQVAAHEARQLAELLTKYAGKADEADPDRSDDDGDEKKDKKSDKDDDDDDDKDKDDDDDDDDEKDDDDDEKDDEDKKDDDE